MAELSEETIAGMMAAPDAEFDAPGAVLGDERLSIGQKIKILEAWEQATRRQVAAGAAGRDDGGTPNRRLGEIEQALASLITLESGGDAGVTLKGSHSRQGR